ncbi:MAG: hypothetical protein V1921_04735 [Candidatus Altiarchaeota archaeon]
MAERTVDRNARIKDLPKEEQAEEVGKLTSLLREITEKPIGELLSPRMPTDRLKHYLSQDPNIRTKELGVLQADKATLAPISEEEALLKDQKMMGVRNHPRSLYPQGSATSNLELYQALTNPDFINPRVEKALAQLTAHGFANSLGDINTFRFIRINPDVTKNPINTDQGCYLLAHLPVSETTPNRKEIPFKSGNVAVALKFNSEGEVTGISENWAEDGGKIRSAFDAYLFIVSPEDNYYRRMEVGGEVSQSDAAWLRLMRKNGLSKLRGSMPIKGRDDLEIHEVTEEGRTAKYGFRLKNGEVESLHRITERPAAVGRLGKTRFGIHVEPQYFGAKLDRPYGDMVKEISLRYDVRQDDIRDAVDGIVSVDPDIVEMKKSGRNAEVDEVKERFISSRANEIALTVKLKRSLAEMPDAPEGVKGYSYSKLFRSALKITSEQATNLSYVLEDSSRFVQMWKDAKSKLESVSEGGTSELLQKLYQISNQITLESEKTRRTVEQVGKGEGERTREVVREESEKTRDEVRRGQELMADYFGQLRPDEQRGFIEQLAKVLPDVADGLEALGEDVTELRDALKTPTTKTQLILRAALKAGPVGAELRTITDVNLKERAEKGYKKLTNVISGLKDRITSSTDADETATQAMDRYVRESFGIKG